MKTKIILLALGMFSLHVTAQSPVSGFMQNSGEGAVSLSYNYESFDKVLLVPSEIDGVPVFNEKSLSSFNLYSEIGLSDRFNVTLSIPYIDAEGEATQAVLNETGFENSRNGLQDLGIHLKYLVTSLELGTGNLDLIGSVGIETPLSDYEVDEGLQSILAIGNGSTRFNSIGIATYKLQNGLFATGQFGYSIRNNDVPNALLSQLKIGYAGANIYGDVYLGSQKSTSGVDILGEGFTGFFPAAEVSYTILGANVYVPFADKLGASVGVGQILAGRNIGKATGYSAGLTYSF